MEFLHGYLNHISDLSRKSKVFLQIVTDVFVAAGCFMFALLLAGERVQLIADPAIFFGMIVAITSGVAAFASFGLYQSLVRFITGNVLIVITKGVLVASSSLGLFTIVTNGNIPPAVPFNYAILLFLSTGGIRFLIKRLFRNPYQRTKKSAVIYGAGEAGRELQNTLLNNQEIRPVAFIDDNAAIHGLTVGGCDVYPSTSFAKIAKKHKIELVLLALPNISRLRRREIVDEFRGLNVELKTIPSMSKILHGEASVADLRPVTHEMLLGRDPISSINGLLQRNITGKSVMVTGAGGSIGSELCRQILAQHPSKITLLEISEFALFKINDELLQASKKINGGASIIPVLGSVRDKKRVSDTIEGSSVQTIYHAAAYKHVPLLEENVVEGINNNIFGTLTIVQIAAQLGVESFTLISTDKAVRPTNVMGASKRCAELICQAYATDTSKTKFSMVRFGNVLGSSGSVVPQFQKQIEAGGPVTVTHPEIMRYFMTIREASDLVIQAGAMAEGGDVFVLDMGEPVKITDLAVDMIKLAGLFPYYTDKEDNGSPPTGHIPICFTGLRDGEKLYEELLISNSPEPTKHTRIMKATEVSLPKTKLAQYLKLLQDACGAYELSTVLSILKEMPLEFSHNKVQSIDIGPVNLEGVDNLRDAEKHEFLGRIT